MNPRILFFPCFIARQIDFFHLLTPLSRFVTHIFRGFFTWLFLFRVISCSWKMFYDYDLW